MSYSDLDPRTDPDQDPLTVTDVYDLICPRQFPDPTGDFRDISHGKWMIFKQFKDLNKTWQVIREEVRSGRLGATGAKCSTLKYDPCESGTGPTTMGRISVFTRKDDLMDIGMKLIKLPVVQHDIKYKAQGYKEYVHTKKDGRVASVTLYWNIGRPSTHLNKGVPRSNIKRKYDRDGDIWKINIVSGASHYNAAEVHGKWVIVSTYKKELETNISKLWYTLKPLIEKGEIPAICMECPHSDRWRDDPPKIYVFTSKDMMSSVGEKLFALPKEDIMYIANKEGKSTFHWNSGEPSFSM